MRVLVLGWEFPPAKTGGLGTHCYELVKNLGRKGISVLLLIPKKSEDARHDLQNVEIVEVGSLLSNPYNPKGSTTFERGYGWNFFDEVEAFNEECVALASAREFDIIHCHDWMTIAAGQELRKRTGKPLVFTIHSTEYDRTANLYPFKNIIDAEKKGIDEADLVITVSSNMKEQLIERYEADQNKVAVIYNGVDYLRFPGITEKAHRNIVLFLGRLTNQKGPDFFLHAAAKVLETEQNVLFVVAGQGEKLPQLIGEAISLGIMDHVVFTGYLSEAELLRAYEMADVYVMPSVAEPFGITALEAIASGTPTIVSKKAGVSERIGHCFKVDYWDTWDIANKIICILRYHVLGECMRRNSLEELKGLGWDRVAQQTIEAYGRA
ncbi:MAG: glycosyltransferase family 4 protein [Candidatus Bathyarchaeota archaeon]|nr:glycosyltransferase family 4 protein [Candidatus Bathyarchaeota archaeon]